MQYWFNTKTGEVEQGDDPGRARSADLMGPYDNEADAARAYEIAAEKTEKWDDEEREDDNWDNNPFNDKE